MVGLIKVSYVRFLSINDTKSKIFVSIRLLDLNKIIKNHTKLKAIDIFNHYGQYSTRSSMVVKTLFLYVYFMLKDLASTFCPFLDLIFWQLPSTPNGEKEVPFHGDVFG